MNFRNGFNEFMRYVQYGLVFSFVSIVVCVLGMGTWMVYDLWWTYVTDANVWGMLFLGWFTLCWTVVILFVGGMVVQHILDWYDARKTV